MFKPFTCPENRDRYRHRPCGRREELATTDGVTLRFMGPERRRRHHYIPVFLQKHFCDADGMLWYGIRDTHVVKRLSPSGAFVKRELYTSYEEAHQLRDRIVFEPHDRYERTFAELEKRAAPAIRKLIAGTRHLMSSRSKELLTQLSPAEITYCKQLLISSMNRTPDAIELAIVKSGARSNRAIWKLVRQELHRFPKPVQDEFFHRSLRSVAAYLASDSHHHLPGGFNLGERGLAVAAYSSPTRRFIFGSCGVAVLPAAEDDLDGDWLPISPDQAIGLSDDPANIRLFKDWDGLRCRINEALAKRSRFIAGDSKSLVKRMLKKH